MRRNTQKTEQIVVSGCPTVLVDKIDALAKAEKRSRAKQVVVLLEEIFARKMITLEELSL